MSTILIYVLIGLIVLGGVSTIFMIGRQREPISHGQAIFSVIVDVILIIWLLSILN